MAKAVKGKPKGATVPAGSVGRPCWSGFAAGLALGLLVAGLVYLNAGPAPEEDRRAAHEAPPSAEGGEGRFQFYTLLPEMEVVVPEPEGEAPPAGETGAPVTQPPPAQVTRPGTYVLQAGSFRRRADAERRKASLALLGVRSTIQAVTLENGETWYRVRIGPYTSLEDLNRTRALLQENDVDTLLVRLRKNT